MQGEVSGTQYGSLGVKRQADILIVLRHHGLQNACHLFVYDDASGDAALYGAVGTLHQFAAVGAGKHDAVGLDVHIDTVHGRAYLVVGCGKEASADAVEQHLGGERECGATLLGAYGQRIYRGKLDMR